jgi:hypothetical protein
VRVCVCVRLSLFKFKEGKHKENKEPKFVRIECGCCILFPLNCVESRTVTVDIVGQHQRRKAFPTVIDLSLNDSARLV